MKSFKECLSAGLLFLILIAATSVKAQNPTYKLYANNVVQTSSNTLEFDIYLLHTGGTNFELATMAFGLYLDSNITRNSNTSAPYHNYLVASIVPGTSTLSNPLQYPASPYISITSVKPDGWAGPHCFNLATIAIPGSGNGSIISNNFTGCTQLGTRISRFKITSQVSSTNTTPAPFKNNSLCNAYFNPAQASGATMTVIAAYVGGVAQPITTPATHFGYNTPNTCFNNIVLNPTPVITSFTPSTLHGGVGQVITINGSGFGASRGTLGSIIFKNANDGGATEVELDNADWATSTWTDNQITVALPSVVSTGTPGSGYIKVRNGLGATGQSATQLNIDYAISGWGTAKSRSRLGSWKCKGMTFYLGNGAAPNASQISVIQQACAAWSLQLNIPISLNTTQPTTPWSNQDGTSAIYISNFMTPNVRSTRHTTLCNNEMFLTETDIEIKDAGVNWHYGVADLLPAGKLDFYAAMLHEIGHALGLENVIDLTNGAAEVMHYTVPVGQINAANRTNLITGGGDSKTGVLNDIVNPSLAFTYNFGFCAPDLTILRTFANALPTVSATSTSVCFNNPVTLTCSTPLGMGYTYLWSTGSASNAISITSAGTYSVTVTINGCTATSNPVTITGSSPSIVTVQPTPQSTCAGGTASFTSGGTAGSTYQWQRNINNSGWTDVSNGTSYANTTTATLNVLNAQYYNGTLQQYRCMVRQGSNCSAPSNAATLTVQTVSMVPLNSVYSNAAAFTLTAGSPSGGVYSGPGVSGGVFTPSTAGVGNHTITYTKTGCSPTSYSQVIQVVAPGAPTTTINSNISALCLATSGNTPLSVTYNALGTFIAGNIFTVQLSNSSGSFAAPTNIGVLSSITSSTISCNIPSTVANGTGYRLRIVSTNPVTTGYINLSPIDIDHYPCIPDRLAGNTVDKVEAAANVKIYPNPASNKLTVELTDVARFNQLSIYDVNGKKYTELVLSNALINNVDITLLPAGTYFVKLTNAQQTIHKKIVIMK